MTCRRLKILIVEDNIFIALDLEAQLEELGCETIGIAVTSDAAIEAARRTKPDLAFIDLQLAGASRGQDVATVLRVEMNVPSVILSGSVHSVTAEERATIRPLAMLSKPVLPHELRTVVERCGCEGG